MQDRHRRRVGGFYFRKNQALPPSYNQPQQLRDKAARGTIRSSYETNQRAALSAEAKKRGRTRLYELLLPSHQSSRNESGMVPATISYLSSEPKLPRMKTASSSNSPARKQCERLLEGATRRVHKCMNKNPPQSMKRASPTPEQKGGLRIPVTRGMARWGRRKQTND